MDKTDVSQFLPLFRAEALDRLQRATEGILALERNLAAPGMLDDCRREVHTVKGAAGMVQRADIAQRARVLEDLLTEVGQGRHQLTPELTRQMLNELDQLRGLVAAIG